MYFTHASQSPADSARQGPAAWCWGGRLRTGLQVQPSPSWEPAFSAFFFFFVLVALRGQGRGCPPWRVPPSAERVGVEAASLQGEGGCCRGLFAGLPDARGTGTKGWLQGTMVGRLVTVRRRPGTQSSLCLRPAGQALPPRPRAFCLHPPRWPVNPLLPKAYLARGLGHPSGAPAPRGHAGGRARGRLPGGRSRLGPAGCPWPRGGRSSGAGSPRAICAAPGRAFG